MTQYLHQPTNTITGIKNMSDSTRYISIPVTSSLDLTEYDKQNDLTYVGLILVTPWNSKTPSVLMTAETFNSEYISVDPADESKPPLATPPIAPRVQDATGAWWEMGVGEDGSAMLNGPYASFTGNQAWGS